MTMDLRGNYGSLYVPTVGVGMMYSCVLRLTHPLSS